MQDVIIQGYRLSPQQKHLWLLQEGGYTSPYRAACAILIEGALDKDLLAGALTNLVESHEILHTTFQHLDGDSIPMQVIEDGDFGNFSALDVSALDSDQQQARLEDLWEETLRAPSDYARSPLRHTSLIILSRTSHILILGLPALCADATALGILARKLYHSYVNGARAEEPDGPIQYVDLSEWQNKLFEEEETQLGRDYWRQKDLTALENARLPFELQCTNGIAFTPEHLSLRFEPDALAKIKDLAADYQISTSALLMSCWQILLGRLCGKSEVLVGAGYDGRRYEDLKDAVGLFTKYLPVGARFSQSGDLAEFVEQIDESMKAAFKRQEYYFYEQDAAAETGAHFFAFCFDHRNGETSHSSGKVTFSILKQYICTDRFKIKLSCVERDCALFTEFHYDKNLFRVEDIQLLASLYHRLVGRIVFEKETEIGGLLSLNADEQERLGVRLASADAEKSVVDRRSQTFQKPEGVASNATTEPATGANEFPLSFAQQRLWFLDQLDPGSSAYNIPAAARLSGRLDVTTLERTLNEVIRRHESLRTTFAEQGGQPRQIIHPYRPQPLDMLDLSALPAEERETQARRLAEEEARRPFDLSRGPLLRLRLLRLREDEYALLFTMHHIVSDGWSMGVLVREVTALYQAFSQGKSSPLPELPLQYADYAIRQREWLQGEVLETQLAYWRRQLGGELPVLELPTDRRRSAASSRRGARHSFSVPAEVTESLRRLSRQEEATMFMTLLAAFKALLCRYGGQEDVVVGSPVANRTSEEFEGLIGFLVNTLALRTDLSGNPTFRELVRRVREVTLGAYVNQDVPFEKLVEELQPERNLSGSPLFNVTFGLQSAQDETLQLPGLTLRPMGLGDGVAKFDLSLDLVETEHGLKGELKYQADLFDESTVRRMAEHFVRLLEGAAAGPDTRLGELPLLTEEERRFLLGGVNDTDANYSFGDCIHELFEAQAERTPNAIAVVFEDQSLTYEQLNRRANQAARTLMAKGVGRGSYTPVLLDRSLELVISLLSVMKTGAAFSPLDINWPIERLRQALDDLGGGPVLVNQGTPYREEELGRPLLLVDAKADCETIPNPNIPVDSLDPIYVIYTSGSTGRPKGVMIPHRGITNRFFWMNDYLGSETAAAALQTTRHVYDSAVWQLFWPLINGGKTVIPPAELEMNADHLAALISRQGVTIADFVPSAFNSVAPLLIGDAGMREKLASLRCVIIGGEEITPATTCAFKEHLPEVKVINLYGPTEASIGCVCYQVNGSEGDRIPIGRPISNVKVLILDRDRRLAPVGVAGEIYLTGVCLGLGYLNDEEKTRGAFVDNPFPEIGYEKLYKTGDMARWRPDGNIQFLGRTDDQVKIRGFRIELGEVETMIRRLPQARQAVALAREDARGEKILVAYVVTQPESSLTAGEAREQLRRLLPDYMIPSVVAPLDELPLTPGGKVDRRALLGLALPELETRSEIVMPRTAVEATAAAVWAEMLRVERVSVYDNFFDLGGHSLLAAQVISRLRKAFQIELPMRRLFEEPTIAGLARVIEALLQEQSVAPAPSIKRAPREEPPPLSYAQQRLWFLDQLDPGAPTYNLPSAVRLTGRLDTAALERTLNEVVRRHESLRTTFAEVNGEPRQIISGPEKLSLEMIDLSALPDSERETEAARLAREEARRPFDLLRGPLLRARLLRLGEEQHLLLFTMHHIISDGWSMGVLVREVGALYSAYSQGEEPLLPELPVQYADYAVWQRGWLLGDLLEKQLGYWRGQLGGDLPILELPATRPRPVAPSFRGSQESISVSADIVERLRQFGLEEGTTLFMTLLAAFQTLLSRYTGQEDVVVGAPVANRTSEEVEGLIGFFVNTLALRTDLSGDPTFRELARRAQEVALGAFENQDVPFEKLVEELQPKRDLSRNPLFQVTFLLQNASDRRLALPGLSLSMYQSSSAASQFDLALIVAETPQGLVAALEYQEDLFDAESIRRMLRHFSVLLEGIATDPDARLSDLPLLGDEERRMILADWNDTFVDYSLDTPIFELIESQVEQTPSAIAVSFEDNQVSYRELNRRANQLARFLRAEGVGPDVLVGVSVDRSVEMVVGLLGVLKAGGAYVPLDPQYPKERLSFMLEDSKVPVLLTRQGLIETLPPHEARVVCLDTGWEEISRHAEDNPFCKVKPTNLVYMIYTSGSTGRPKGAMNTHRGLCNRLLWMQQAYGLTGADRVLQKTAFSFDVSVWEFFWPLMTGAELVVARPGAHQDSAYLTELIIEREVTTLHFVPSMLQVFIQQPGIDACVSLKRVICSGEALSKELQERFYERLMAELHNLYGPTEASIDVTYWKCERGSGLRTVPIGWPIANSQTYILNARLQPVPAEVSGELHLGGVGLARGYLDRPELTAEKFIPDPFGGQPGGRLYKTGDLTRFLPDGAIEYLGRLDHQVKVRGFRIELGEIEAALARRPEVREVVVLVKEYQDGEKSIIAYIVPRRQGDTLSPAELRAYLKRLLPDYMIPSAFVTLTELPLMVNGKLDRRALAAAEPESSSDCVYLAPRSALEEEVAGLFCEVLRLRRVGVNDNFFELGGHSLLATKAVSRLRKVFGVELALRRMFESPTVEGLARAIEAELREGAPAPPPIHRAPRAAELPLSFAQQRLWFLDQLEPGSAAYNITAAVRLKGKLDTDALGRALDEVFRRHESLRTRFEAVDGRSVQVIDEATAGALKLVDLSETETRSRETFARRLVREEGQRPFDLSRDRLLRAILLALSQEEHTLLLTMHHIVSDGWSINVLVRELTTLYDAFSNGRPSPLADLPIQYADYAAWQRGWLQGGTLEAEMAYWRRSLTGAPPLLELQTDRPRPPVRSYRGAVESLEISRDVTEALRQLSRQEGVTLFMTLLAAFAALLSRYTSQDDIVVGAPIANRNRVEVEDLIGFFVNTLALRADLTGDPSFRELLGRVREVALGAYAHQDVPFEKLVDEIQPERNLSHSPLFQVMFALQEASLSVTAELPGLELTSLQDEIVAAKFDLTLGVIEAPSGLSTSFTYDTDLFDGSTIRRMLEHFHSLLASAIENADERISRLRLLSQSELDQLLVEFSATGKDPAPGKLVAEQFEEQAALRPDAVAVVFEDQSLSYGRLNSRANQLAHLLQRLGVGPDVLVALFFEHSLDAVVSLMGVIKAGGVYLPLDPAHPRERLANMLDDAQPRVLLSQAELGASLPDHQALLVCPDLAQAEIESESEKNPARGVSHENLAYVIYTSGSTGRPKGVCITQRAAAGHFATIRKTFELVPDDRVLEFASLNFDGSIEETFPALLSGATLILRSVDIWSAGEFWRKVRELGLTVFNLSPAYWHELLNERELVTAGQLRLMSVGADVLRAESVKAWRKSPLRTVRFLNAYGPTEATVTATVFEFGRDEDEKEDQKPPIGRPLANRRTYILDRTGNPTPAGVAGELRLGGEGLSRGYLNGPELTAERFVPDAYGDEAGARVYRTGDLARYLPDGNIEFLGRADHQVKVRGFRIEVGEIESQLMQLVNVREAVVIAREDTPGVKRLVAYMAPDDAGADEPERLSPESLRARLSERLPDYMIPTAWVWLPEFPLTSSGKIDRRALPAPEHARQGMCEPESPRTPVEATLAEIWAQVLGLEQVGVHDNFFYLGGDSILSIQIIARANQAGLRLTPKQLFQHQTIASLAAVATVVTSAQIVEEVVAGSAALTPIQRWFFDQDFAEPQHFNQSVLLEVRRGVDVEALLRVIQDLIKGHDALRLRFERKVSGWEQVFAGGGDAVSVARVSLSDTLDAKLPAAIRKSANEFQSGLDLSDGPLMRAVFFDLGEDRPGRLLLVIHHLLVDGVSWRILLEDLHAGYEQLRKGAEIRFGVKTTSFKRWSERLKEYAQSEEIRSELSYWLNEDRAKAPRLPVDFPIERGAAEKTNRSDWAIVPYTVDTVGVVSVALDAEETRALLSEVPRVFRTEINDFLLTALAQSFAAWTGQPFLLVDLEGHGREELFPDLDLSRTVGWFTTVFPVLLDLRGAASPAVSPIDALKKVKERLRRIPQRGIGYGLLRYLNSDPQVAERLEALPQAEVIFNYLGQLDQALAQSDLFTAARESSGAARSGRQRLSHLLEINASVAGKRLQAAWAFSTAVHRRETVERLAEGFVRALRELIALCRSARAHCYTPSDFPLASITQEQLDNLVEGRPSAAPDHSLSAAAHAQIEDIYPLSPVQQGMYFHCLSAQPGAYVEQTNCVLRGMVNAASLERAWQTLIERHSILRTSFHLADMDAPLQVVHRTSGLSFRLVEHDLSWMPQEEQERWIADYLAADLKRGFDLSRAPLLRVALARLDARLYRFVLTFHHLLLDGWSAARLFKEVLSLYHGGNGGQEAVAAQPISPGRPFRDYIAWLQRQDLGEAENFWRTVLKGFRTPTPIGESQSYGADARLAPSGYGDKQCVLPASTTRNLQDYARNHQLTLNTMVQGVWALILARHSRTFDVLFGVTVSGRPVELEGVESMLGMFINTLPVRVRMPGARRAVDWLKQIQAEQVEMRQYEYTPLGIVQRWSGAPAGGGLFESLLVFENYPMSAVAREQEGGVRIEAVESSTRTKYSLTLVVSPGAELGLYLAYDRRRFSDESIEKILQEIGETLEVICKGGQELFLSALLQGNEADWVSDREPARDELDAGESIDPPHAPITLPRTVTEEKLAALWAEVMGLDRIDVHGNFFELGGHSLLATQVISRVRATFHGGIALRSLFEYPTVAQLAQHIEEVMRADRSPKAPRLTRVSGDRTRLPLSFAQQRLWILQQLDPLSVAYNIPVAVRLRGHLDFTALQRTFDEIIRRHEALRTTFESRQGEPAQVISEAAPSRITFVDLRGGDEARAEAEIRTMVKAEAARPFDLTSGPLLRTILVSKSEQEHVALLNMHHIISDEWSTNILIREVSALYAAFAHGEPSPLPELEAQYGDYAVWQRDWLKGRALEEQLDYWRRQLNGASMLRLPLDRERSASHIRKGATEEFHLGAEETLRLNELSQAEGCTLFMSVLAAFQTLLHRYSGQDDVVIGADIANRTCPEIEPLIGFFVNQLALRVDFSGNPKFRELMRRTRKVVLEAYEHQDVSFDKVVEVLRLERDLSRAPLFQVKLVFQNTPRGTLQLPGLRLEELDIESGSTRLDLIFYMRETEDGLRGALRYDAALFDASTIKRMLEHFGSILKEAIADPDLPVKFIEMRSEAEKRRQAEEERRREASNLKKLKKIRSISATRKVDPLR